jgi:hypothetical protein
VQTGSFVRRGWQGCSPSSQRNRNPLRELGLTRSRLADAAPPIAACRASPSSIPSRS